MSTGVLSIDIDEVIVRCEPALTLYGQCRAPPSACIQGCRRMTTTPAQRKAAERARHKEAGRVAVTVYIYPPDREKLALYVKRLNERAGKKLPTALLHFNLDVSHKSLI